MKSDVNREVVNVEPGNLPYPSLNEVNFVAFGESNPEYHNELYSFIESEDLLSKFKVGKPVQSYIFRDKHGNTKNWNITLSEYIRHQIHHPENDLNEKFTDHLLQQSIQVMRNFLQDRS